MPTAKQYKRPVCNGWSRLHLEGKEFYKFLEAQEHEIGDLMRDLGFLQC